MFAQDTFAGSIDPVNRPLAVLDPDGMAAAVTGSPRQLNFKLVFGVTLSQRSKPASRSLFADELFGHALFDRTKRTRRPMRRA